MLRPSNFASLHVHSLPVSVYNNCESFVRKWEELGFDVIIRISRVMVMARVWFRVTVSRRFSPQIWV